MWSHAKRRQTFVSTNQSVCSARQVTTFSTFSLYSSVSTSKCGVNLKVVGYDDTDYNKYENLCVNHFLNFISKHLQADQRDSNHVPSFLFSYGEPLPFPCFAVLTRYDLGARFLSLKFRIFIDLHYDCLNKFESRIEFLPANCQRF